MPLVYRTRLCSKHARYRESVVCCVCIFEACILTSCIMYMRVQDELFTSGWVCFSSSPIGWWRTLVIRCLTAMYRSSSLRSSTLVNGKHTHADADYIIHRPQEILHLLPIMHHPALVRPHSNLTRLLLLAVARCSFVSNRGAGVACSSSSIVSMAGRTYIYCPWAEKEECKALHGQWDDDEKRWYIPPWVTDHEPFRKWFRKTKRREIVYLQSR
jgi:Domain of unknown function (DUF5710)